jgi:serine phosphatase RsbU (regulator of sigma subunit)
MNNSQTKRPSVIAIVDDEEMVTSSLGAFLEWETEHQVMTYQSPVTALEAFRDHPIDLVISDFLMPEMNGLQFLQQVKEIYPEVPRILLTGYADKEHAIKAINEIGLFHYFEKPWDNEAIKLAIENGLENKTVKAALKDKLQELDQAQLQRDSLIEENETMQNEMSLARKVQQSMLPQCFPDVAGLRFAAKYLPALEIGGDFYDIQPLNDGRLAILLADMTGHGIQAALSTSLLKLAFAPTAHTDATPVDILTNVNRVLCQGLPQDLPSSIFAAAAAVTIDPTHSTMRIANAGLPHPLYMSRRTGEVARITSSGMILGIFDNEIYRPATDTEISLEKGDTLLLYTDGLDETINEQNELFSVGRIRDIMLQCVGRDSAALLDQLVDAVQTFSKPNHSWDDLTLLGIDII